jgi:hypothetical protein
MSSIMQMRLKILMKTLAMLRNCGSGRCGWMMDGWEHCTSKRNDGHDTGTKRKE